MAALFDVKAAEAEAQKEIADEAVEAAKTKIKGKLQEITKAELVVANLRREYEILLKTIGADAGE